jgi:hypothetical protein
MPYSSRMTGRLIGRICKLTPASKLQQISSLGTTIVLVVVTLREHIGTSLKDDVIIAVRKSEFEVGIGG